MCTIQKIIFYLFKYADFCIMKHFKVNVCKLNIGHRIDYNVIMKTNSSVGF